MHLGPIVAAEKKGLMLDDTTHHWCSDSLHSTWANEKNDATVGSIRIAKAWQAEWTETSKTEAWNQIGRFLHSSGGKALVGTAITCDEDSDDQDWEDVKRLLKVIGAANTMGIAIGNEVDLLASSPDTNSTCKAKLFGSDGGYLFKKMKQRADDLAQLSADWNDVKLTSVFSEYIFSGKPFVAGVNEFLVKAVSTYKTRFTFSINNYPYFDTGNRLDEGTTDKCTKAIAQSICFDNKDCSFNNAVITLRERMSQIQADDNELWVTETGWSSPKADTLVWNPNATLPYYMANCSDFSSLETMQKFYDNFLKWDFTMETSKGPDHVFFFSMRDASQWGGDRMLNEHFGLGGHGNPEKDCVNISCKLQSSFEEEEVVV